MQPKHYNGIIKVAKALHPGWFDKNAIGWEIPANIRIHRGFVAVEKGRVVGFITYTCSDTAGILGWIGVHPGAHRKGIGKKLVQKIERELKKAGFKEIIVETVGWAKPRYKPYETTRKFYKAVGFNRVASKGKIKKQGKWTSRMYTYSKKL